MKKLSALFVIVAVVIGVARTSYAKEGNLYLGETLVCDDSFAGGFWFISTSKECATIVAGRGWYIGTAGMVCKEDGKVYFLVNPEKKPCSLEWSKMGVLTYETDVDLP